MGVSFAKKGALFFIPLVFGFLWFYGFFSSNYLSDGRFTELISQNADEIKFSNILKTQLEKEAPYSFIKQIKEEVNISYRDKSLLRESSEVEITKRWSLVYLTKEFPIVANAVDIFIRDMSQHMGVKLVATQINETMRWDSLQNTIVIGTIKELKQCGKALTGSKDYQIQVKKSVVVVCGFDDHGVMHGLFNLTSRFKLREAPFLSKSLNVTRISYHKRRISLSAIGWMDWPNEYLELLARHGFDGIFASVLANPTGENPPSRYQDMKRQDPKQLKDLIKRAARFGIKVYVPLLYEIKGNNIDDDKLRKLVSNTVKTFPEIQGYVLLIEGFNPGDFPKWYWNDNWYWNKFKTDSWIDKWLRGVKVVDSEVRKHSTDIEVLPWDYNIDFRPKTVKVKESVIKKYPKTVLPIITWINGKKIIKGSEEGYIKDYSISEVGPSEAAQAQINQAGKENIEFYLRADTSSSWQFGTVPYVPVPYQWHKRYVALSKSNAKGIIENWTYGLQSSFVSELRTWYAWSNAPEIDDLLNQYAKNKFGDEGAELAVESWRIFSKAIIDVPDSGPYVSTNTAVAVPFFVSKPNIKMNIGKSDIRSRWSFKMTKLNSNWPYMPWWLSFPRDFKYNKTNFSTHIRPFSLKVFDTYLEKSSSSFERGLKLYRQAAYLTPSHKKNKAFKEVMLVEQMNRMLQSARRLFQFETLRMKYTRTWGEEDVGQLKEKMVSLLIAEKKAVKLSLQAAKRDSRFGYNWAYDYIYSPFVLEEKLKQLDSGLIELRN